jgi:hypothetical protein
MKLKSVVISASAAMVCGAPVMLAPTASAQVGNCWLSESERQPAHVILVPNELPCSGNQIQLVTQGDEVANLTNLLGTAPLVTITMKCADGTELREVNYPLTTRTSYFSKPGCAAKNFARVSAMNFKPSDIVGKLKIRLVD